MTHKAHDPYFFSRAALVRNLKGTRAGTIAQAADELARRGDPRGISMTLGRLLKHRVPRVRASAADAIGKLGITRFRGLLSLLLIDRRQPVNVRESAAYALGLVGDSSAVASLIRVARLAGQSGETKTLARLCMGAAAAAGARPSKANTRRSVRRARTAPRTARIRLHSQFQNNPARNEAA